MLKLPTHEDPAQISQIRSSHFQRKRSPSSSGNKCNSIVKVAGIMSILFAIFIVFKLVQISQLQTQIQRLKQYKQTSLDQSSIQKHQKELEQLKKVNADLKEKLAKISQKKNQDNKKQPQQSTKVQQKHVQQNKQKKDLSKTPYVPVPLQRQNIQLRDEDKLKIPKFVWLYLNNPVEQETYIIQRAIANIKWYSKQSGFDLRIVKSDNYDNWLNHQQTSQLKAVIQKINKAKENDHRVRNKYENIMQRVILLHLMRHLGGIMMSKYYFFTEKFNCFENVKGDIRYNRGNSFVKPQYFAFFAPADGTGYSKENKDVNIQVDKYMILHPGLKQQFLAGVAGGQFLIDLIPQYIQLVTNANYRSSAPGKFQIQREMLDTNDVFNAYTVAAHIIIKRKQLDLDRQALGNPPKYRNFAIDDYGLITMNANYFPDKMVFYFNVRWHYHDNYFSHTALLPQDQMEEVIGPMRYIASADPTGEFNKRVQMASKKDKYRIVQGSFLHRQLFSDQHYDFIEPNKERPYTPTQFEKWEKLPKILWLFWDSGVEKSSATHQLCMMNMQKHAKEAGFKVNYVSKDNAHNFLSKETLNRIQDTLSNAKMTIYDQTPSDFYRLALIYEHGGFYLDASFFFKESFQWIIDIAKQPTRYIYNRFGKVPKALFQYHSLEGGPFEWTVDTEANTKVNWHFAYENNFMATDPDNQLIKEWFEEFIIWAKLTYQQTQEKMKECNIYSHKWSSPTDRYLTAMESLKCVIGRRQKDIDQHPEKYKGIKYANDYYKLWTFNGFTGIQKFRYYNNYVNNFRRNIDQNNIMFHRFSESYSDLVYGKTYKAIKLYGPNIYNLNPFMASNRHNNFVTEAHPQSAFLKYLYNPDEHELFTTDKLHARKKT